MATGETIRHMSFFYKGKKVAMASGTQYDIEGNDEDQFGDEGWVGASNGAVATKIRVDVIVPVAGTRVTVVTDMLAKRYVDVGLGIVDGKIHRVNMRCRTVSFTGASQQGSLTGNWEFTGGKPELTG